MELNLVDVTLLLTITAFIKALFDVHGKMVYLVLFLSGLFLVFSPYLSALNDYLALAIKFVTWFLATAGSYDLATDAGPKIFGAVKEKVGAVVSR